VDRKTSRLITGLGLGGILVLIAIAFLINSYAG